MDRMMRPENGMPDKVRLARLCLLVTGWLAFATAGLFLFILAAGAVYIGGGERAGLLGGQARSWFSGWPADS